LKYYCALYQTKDYEWDSISNCLRKVDDSMETEWTRCLGTSNYMEIDGRLCKYNAEMEGHKFCVREGKLAYYVRKCHSFSDFLEYIDTYKRVIVTIAR